MIKKLLVVALLTFGLQLHAQTFTDIQAHLTGVSGSACSWIDYDQDGDLDVFVSGEFYGKGRHYISTRLYRNDPIRMDTTAKGTNGETGIFTYNTKVTPMAKKIYYYVYASCYCDLYGKGKKDYHVFFSPIKKQPKQYELQRHFNNIIRDKYPFWVKFNQAEIIQNGFAVYTKAQQSKRIAIQEYKSNGFKIHELKW